MAGTSPTRAGRIFNPGTLHSREQLRDRQAARKTNPSLFDANPTFGRMEEQAFHTRIRSDSSQGTKIGRLEVGFWEEAGVKSFRGRSSLAAWGSNGVELGEQRYP